VVDDACVADVKKRFGGKQFRDDIAWERLYNALEVEPPRDHVDPEGGVDPLPQPYRMINKLLRGVVDAAWTQLQRLAAVPNVDQHRAKMRALWGAPNLGRGSAAADVTAVCVSADGSRLFCGTASGATSLFYVVCAAAASLHLASRGPVLVLSTCTLS
jgi:hypothetical protein